MIDTDPDCKSSNAACIMVTNCNPKVLHPLLCAIVDANLPGDKLVSGHAQAEESQQHATEDAYADAEWLYPLSRHLASGRTRSFMVSHPKS